GGGGGGGGGGNVLENGDTVSGLSGSTGSWDYYTIDLPAGATNLSVEISGGSGDADLYVRFGSQPTTSAYDCRPYRNGNNETCDFAAPNSGTWHIGIRAYSSYSGVTLTAGYDAPGGGGGGGSCSVDVDFESGASGWSNTGSCGTGAFTLGTPSQQSAGGVVTQVGGDHTSGSGNAVYTASNTSAGRDDVDRGECVLEGPVWNVSSASTLDAWYFHGQRDTGDDSGDYFVLEMSTNGGSSYSTIVSIGDTRTTAAWTEASANVPAGSSVKLRMRVADGTGGGDIIEAGLDDITICN
ncbi:MAG: PPC domain-containing protein, partial [Pseudomonadota bacterium]